MNQVVIHVGNFKKHNIYLSFSFLIEQKQLQQVPKSSVLEAVEAVVIGNGDISSALQ